MKRKNKTIAKAVGVGLSAAAISAALLTGCDWFPIPYAVYGPPPMPEESMDQNIPETVYGPPEWFEPENNVPEDVYGPPPFEDDYDPEEELPAPVYGPPEWFEEEPATPAPGENP